MSEKVKKIFIDTNDKKGNLEISSKCWVINCANSSSVGCALLGYYGIKYFIKYREALYVSFKYVRKLQGIIWQIWHLSEFHMSVVKIQNAGIPYPVTNLSSGWQPRWRTLGGFWSPRSLQGRLTLSAWFCGAVWHLDSDGSIPGFKGCKLSIVHPPEDLQAHRIIFLRCNRRLSTGIENTGEQNMSGYDVENAIILWTRKCIWDPLQHPKTSASISSWKCVRKQASMILNPHLPARPCFIFVQQAPSLLCYTISGFRIIRFPPLFRFSRLFRLFTSTRTLWTGSFYPVWGGNKR